MSKILYRRREFLEPFSIDQTAYVYGYVKDFYTPSRGKKARKRNKTWDYGAEFGLHSGNDTLHLHFDWGRNGKVLSRDLAKLRKIALLATELADVLEKT